MLPKGLSRRRLLNQLTIRACRTRQPRTSATDRVDGCPNGRALARSDLSSDFDPTVSARCPPRSGGGIAPYALRTSPTVFSECRRRAGRATAAAALGTPGRDRRGSCRRPRVPPSSCRRSPQASRQLGVADQRLVKFQAGAPNGGKRSIGGNGPMSAPSSRSETNPFRCAETCPAMSSCKAEPRRVSRRAERVRHA